MLERRWIVYKYKSNVCEFLHTNIVLFRTVGWHKIFLHLGQKFDLCLGSHRDPLLGFDYLHSNLFIIARINGLENLAA